MEPSRPGCVEPLCAATLTRSNHSGSSGSVLCSEQSHLSVMYATP
jgi:hypothetical protein